MRGLSITGSEEIWDILGAIRHAIKEELPGLILSANETQLTVDAEIAAIQDSIRKIGRTMN